MGEALKPRSSTPAKRPITEISLSSATELRVQRGESMVDTDPYQDNPDFVSANSTNAMRKAARSNLYLSNPTGDGKYSQVNSAESTIVEGLQAKERAEEAKRITSFIGLTDDANRKMIDFAASKGTSLSPTIENAGRLGLYVSDGTGATFPRSQVPMEAYSGAYASNWNIGTRVMGAIQLVGGIAGAAVGATAIAGGGAFAPVTAGGSLMLSAAGWFGFAASVDQAAAGFRTMLLGQQQATLAGTVIQKTTGMSPHKAEFVAGMLTLSPTVMEGSLLSRSVDAAAKSNTEVRAYNAAVDAQDAAQAAKAAINANRSSSAQAAIELEQSLAGHSVRDVNPNFPTSGRTMNCANCAIATDATLAGRPAVAMQGEATSVADLTKFFNKGTINWLDRSSEAAITNTMKNWGDGARGVVYGFRGPDEVGHFFNVVNQNGKIRFLDGQIGGAAKLDDGYIRMFLLRTDK